MSVRVNAPEILFHPELLGYNIASVAQAIINAIMKLDRQHWRVMLKNIVLSGGNSMFQGFNFRLEDELKKVLPQLGPLPEPKEPKILKKPQMVNAATPSKAFDTCPKCSERVNLAFNQTCPKCGHKFAATTISIPSNLIYPDRCPSCRKKLEEKNPFCPFCGGKINPVPSNKRRNLRPVEIPPQISQLEKIKASEFDEESLVDSTGGEIIKIILPSKRNTAIFNGASVLGSIPSAKKLFITYEQYLQDPNTIALDFSQLL